MMRLTSRYGLVALCTVVLLLCGCGKKDQEPPKKQSPSPSAAPASAPAIDGAQQAAETRAALAKANEGKAIEALSPDALKALLPADLPGMKRTDASGERNEMMGVSMSVAEGQYAADGDASIDVTITDAGNLSGPMRMGLTGWAMAQYNRETDTGYEKTTTYAGYKAMEKYDRQDKDGTLRVFVADRFIVEIQGNGITMETLKEAAAKIDMKKLAAAK